MRRIVLCGMMLAALLRGAPAAEPEKPEPAATEKKKIDLREPSKIVDETVAEVIAILEDPKFKEKSHKRAMREKVRTIILGVTDMDVVSQLTLANYRKKFSDKQFKEFTEVFAQLLFTTYIEHLEKYTDEKVVITGTRKLTETRIIVKTDTLTDTRTIPVEYSFIKQGKSWKLYDVQIEGVSLIKNYRSQFREILIQQSPKEFLERLTRKVRENEEKL